MCFKLIKFSFSTMDHDNSEKIRKPCVTSRYDHVMIKGSQSFRDLPNYRNTFVDLVLKNI